MSKIEIGFTGTQDGISEERLNDIGKIIADYHADYERVWLHHGACLGADTQVHSKYFNKVHAVIVHPPVIQDKQGVWPIGGLEPNTYWRTPYDYLVRNRHIVRECDVLIAAPATPNEVLRSGTWATIRYARKIGREIIQV